MADLDRPETIGVRARRARRQQRKQAEEKQAPTGEAAAGRSPTGVIDGKRFV
jgi:hypothetical protein